MVNAGVKLTKARLRLSGRLSGRLTHTFFKYSHTHLQILREREVGYAELEDLVLTRVAAQIGCSLACLSLTEGAVQEHIG